MNNNVKDYLLDSVNDDVIKLKSKDILEKFNNQKIKKNQFRKNLMVLTSSLLTGGCCAGVIFGILNNQNDEDMLAKIPTKFSAQVEDISFGISSATSFLSNNLGIKQQNALIKNKGGYGPGPEPQFETEEEDYITPLNEMYSLAEPYLYTIDSLLNGAEMPYTIELSDNEEFPYKLGDLIFNVVENKDEEGEISEEESDTNPDDESVLPKDIISQNIDTQEDETEEPDFTVVDEFYEITGQLTIGESVYPVTGEQINFAVDTTNDDMTYSELYINVSFIENEVNKELTVYKSSYESSFSNTFRDINVNASEKEEVFAYIESIVTTTTNHRGKEIEQRDVVNSVVIDAYKESMTIGNDENSKTRDYSDVYMSLESSYLNAEEIENTINADLSFRLPQESKNVDNNQVIEDGEGETEAEEETLSKAFRVDYDIEVIQNKEFEMNEEYGHGQRGHDYYRGPGEPHPQCGELRFSGSFFINKDSNGTFVKPDFENEGSHHTERGYDSDWFWNW